MPKSSLTDLNVLQIVFDLCIVRVYFVNNEFFISHVSMDEIKYNAYRSSVKCLTYIMKYLVKAKNIDVRFFTNTHTTKTDTKDNIKFLSENKGGYYDSNNDIKRLILQNLLFLI